ncbi:MAG: ribbon-helix-helix domain-containing protein [Oricola sp.]
METLHAEPFFRAINARGTRKGLRLERDFWSLLEMISREENMTVGDIVATISAGEVDTGNLTSAVRVFVAHWLNTRLSGFRELMSPAAVNGLVNACPTPAFALSAMRQLRFQNPAFQRYVRMAMPSEETDQMERKLRLQFDMNMDDLLHQLRDDGRPFVPLGFAIGVNDRRVRGRLNAILAPSWDEEMIIGYVIA